MTRIHIVGTGPRTGTTLLAEAMVACFHIDTHTAHEDRVVKEFDGEIVLTKDPGDLPVIRPLLLADPQLFVICMVRDPRDAIVSRHGEARDKYWAGLVFWKAYLPHWRRIRHHPRVLTVRYEDFVTDPDAIQARIEAWLPVLRRRAAFSRYHEYAAPSAASVHALRGVRPITPVGIGAYRQHLGRVRAQIERHGSISADLIAFGYEFDTTWEAQLQQAAPDHTPSHWPEALAPARRRRRRRGLAKAVVKALLRRAGIEPSRIRRPFGG